MSKACRPGSERAFLLAHLVLPPVLPLLLVRRGARGAGGLVASALAVSWLLPTEGVGSTSGLGGNSSVLCLGGAGTGAGAGARAGAGAGASAGAAGTGAALAAGR